MANEPTSQWKVMGVVGFYMAVALVMVMVNKWVLTASALPLLFLFLQLSISVLCLSGLSQLPAESKLHFVTPRWTQATLLAVTPVCVANVVGLVFNIFCLKLVDASYFQVARGLTLPMTVVLSSLTTGEKPSMATIASCGLVTWGFTYSFIPAPLLHSTAVPHFDAPSQPRAEAPMLGMVFGVASAAMVAIHAVLVKSALKFVDGRALDLAYWQNALCALALVPAIIFSDELGTLAKMINGAEGSGSLTAFVSGSLITGVVGFLICVAGLLSIKVTSPITHMFSAAVRSVLQTMLGVYIFGDILNSTRVISILLILVGSILYTYFKSKGFSPSKGETGDSTAKEPLLSGKERSYTRLMSGTHRDPEKGEKD